MSSPGAARRLLRAYPTMLRIGLAEARGIGLIVGLIAVLIVRLELIGRSRRVAGERRRVADRAGQQPADTVTERGDVLTRKSRPAALGGAPTEHAEEIDHPRLLAFRDDPARRSRANSRDLPHRAFDSPMQHE